MATTKNGEVVDLLQTIGDLMELRGDESFRVRAYREAARQLDQVTEDIEALSREGRLTDIKGVGPSIARTVQEFLETGDAAQRQRLSQEVPESLIELLGLRHFGPQRIVRVHRALGVTTLDELEAAARDGRLLTVSGFGARSVETLLQAIATFREQRKRIPRYLAESVAAGAVHGLRQMAGLGAGEVVVTGEMRRWCETVEEIELLAQAEDPQAVVDAFQRLSLFREVVESGPQGALALTRERYPVRLHVVAPGEWGPALQRTTGSAAHNTQLEERAAAAPPPGEASAGGPADAPASTGAPGAPEESDDAEAAVYARLGLPLIPPELREGRGEIAAALTGRLPRLIRLADVRGDLHMHTTWSDGKHSVEEMAREALRLGREYIAIADHSQSLGVARGLTLERLEEQRREIAAVDAALPGIRLLSSVELDILSDGSLDYPDEVLARFDFVTASLHSGFGQPGERLTQRVLTAMGSRHVDAIGHLTGRILGRRDPLELDVEAILRRAAETGTALEINAWPNRLDLNEEHARRAKELGVRLVINTDSHSADQLAYLHSGVEVARRAWLEPQDVLNTLPLERLLAYLEGRPNKG
ncbi:MAG TPA: DNA polymerase/3'-5' exonuclease PolX [Chloroflexota bacterium]|nr:DNA polymerase/3'-5' exonuclease PolX [Chloroflexota bacterium]